MSRSSHRQPRAAPLPPGVHRLGEILPQVLRQRGVEPPKLVQLVRLRPIVSLLALHTGSTV